MSQVQRLELEGVIGFGGKVPNGLKWHQDGEHLIYPLGSTVVIKNIATGNQIFLTGHTADITCIALSPCGHYIASGQRTEMGNKCPILLWDFEQAIANVGTDSREGELKHKLILHKVAIQDLDFSYDSKFLASVGGQDDNTFVIWELENGKAICGTPAANYAAMSVRWYHGRNDRLVTCGQYHIRKWEFNYERRRLFPDDLKTGGVKRIFTTVATTQDDLTCYAGTSTGDILQFNLENGNFVTTSSHRFSLGVITIQVLEDGYLICGTGDGALVKLSLKDLKFSKAAELLGGVTSIALSADQQSAFIGTEGGNIYGVAVPTLETQLRGTGHNSPVVDVIFPNGTSELFITAGGCEIRIWHSIKRTELLRIQVPNLKVLCCAINSSGTSIISGWDDGKIRAFTPETGRIQYTINDAHAEGVSAIAVTHDGTKIISGGKDGRVRTWNVSGRTQKMELSFKEHKKEVTSIRVAHNDEEALSSAADGSCCVWNLRRGTRANALFASTVFRTILYHPDESQLLTCGSDRKITYWDTTDCTAIRVMDGSTADINSIDIEKDGVYFASGGSDRLVKLWLYDEGDQVAVGTGHSGNINRVAISPDKRIIVSVGTEGAVFIWRMPEH